MLQNYSKALMIGLAVAFMVLPIIFIGLRLWAKLLSAKKIGWDDYLAGFATTLSITCCSLQLITALYGHLGQHQPLHPDGTAILDDPGLILFERTKFALNLLGIVGLGLIKTSILLYYASIFTIRNFRLATYVMLGIVWTWTIGYFFGHLFSCYPITVFIEAYYGNKCFNQVPMFLSVAISGTIIDFLILMMPVPVIMGLQLPLQQRIAVMGILLLGAAVCSVSIARVVALYEVAGQYLLHPNDGIYYTAPIFFWVNIELSLAIVSACLPTLRPIWTHFRPPPVKFPTQSSSGISSGVGRSSRRRYADLDELELTRYDEMESRRSAEHEQPEGRIVRDIHISQSSERM